MAINDIVQTIAEARVDARSLSEFVFKPTGFKVARRLAPTVDTLQFYIDRFNSLNGDFSSSVSVALSSLNSSVAEADGKVAYIETTVQDAINNTAVEGGVLADTFVTATANGVGTIARTQRDINAESVSIHSFGECGNGAEDTAVFNLAMSTLSSLAKADGKPRVLRLIAGKTYNLNNAKYYPLVDLVCVDGVATLKRVDVPEGTLESVAKWWRILDAGVNSATWNSDLAYSHRSTLRNIVFDGNKANARWSGGYQQEQASCLFLSGQNQTDINKRVKFQLENITFKDSVSDGLHYQKNVDIVVNNCFAYRCFRGGLVSTGGNSIIRLNGWWAEDARYDCEIDIVGSNDTRKSEYYINNYFQDMQNDNGLNNQFVGGIDFGAIGQGGTLVFDNVHIGSLPCNWIGTSSVTTKKFKKFKVTNSSFVIGEGLPIQNPLNYEVINTDFIIDNRNKLVDRKGLVFTMSAHGNIADTLSTTLLKGVRILALDPLDTSNIKGALVDTGIQKKDDNKLLKLIDCDFSGVDTNDGVVGLTTGGKVFVDNITVSGGVLFVGNGVYGDGLYPIEITVGAVNFIKSTTLFSGIYTTANNPTYNNKITFLPNFIIGEANSGFKPAFPHNGAFLTVKGYRKVRCGAPPVASTPSYKGDIFTLQDRIVGKPYEWYATKIRAYEGSQVWVATKWLTGSFATVNLPALTAFDVGAQNYDTTLNKIVTWSGAAWI